MKRVLVLLCFAVISITVFSRIGFEVGIAGADTGSASVGSAAAAMPATAPTADQVPNLTSPVETLSALEKLGHDGLWFCVVIVIAYELLVLGKASGIAWLQTPKRVHYLTAAIAFVGTFAVAAAQGRTPTAPAVIVALGTVYGLFRPGVGTSPSPSSSSPPPATPPAPSQAGFIRRRLMLAIGAIGITAITAIACSANQRASTITTTLNAVNAAEAGFVTFDGKHQLDLVSAATSHDAGVKVLADYRADRDKVATAFVAAYKAIAAAAAANDDPSMATMAAAAAVVVADLKSLGVTLP